jgi:hypothetical protein
MLALSRVVFEEMEKHVSQGVQKRQKNKELLCIGFTS